jgi:hypothetical protein
MLIPGINMLAHHTAAKLQTVFSIQYLVGISCIPLGFETP